MDGKLVGTNLRGRFKTCCAGAGDEIIVDGGAEIRSGGRGSGWLAVDGQNGATAVHHGDDHVGRVGSFGGCLDDVLNVGNAEWRDAGRRRSRRRDGGLDAATPDNEDSDCKSQAERDDHADSKSLAALG